MTVFVVLQIRYDDSEVSGVFETREQADEHCRIMRIDHPGYDYDITEIPLTRVQGD